MYSELQAASSLYNGTGKVTMKTQFVLFSGLALLLASSACSKKVAAAPPRPPDAAPVAQAQPAPAPAPPKPNVSPTPTPQPTPVAQTPPPANRPLTPQDRATLNQSLARLEDALFDYDKSTIRSDASVALKSDVDVIRSILVSYPSQKLLIEGYADERGSEEYNLALGDRRARAAQDFLTSMSVPAGQLDVISYGKERPVCTDQTEACWQKNRRVHVTAAP
jgi:peptidoglycan-associated lipoprotein